jgi:hypothetical protein
MRALIGSPVRASHCWHSDGGEGVAPAGAARGGWLPVGVDGSWTVRVQPRDVVGSRLPRAGRVRCLHLVVTAVDEVVDWVVDGGWTGPSRRLAVGACGGGGAGVGVDG